MEFFKVSDARHSADVRYQLTSHMYIIGCFNIPITGIP